MRTKFLSKNVIRRDHLGDKRIDVRTVPKRILKNWCKGNEFIWFREEFGGGGGSFENSFLIKGGELLDQLNNWVVYFENSCLIKGGELFYQLNNWVVYFENSCLIKGGELLDQLNNYHLTQNGSAPQNLTLLYLKISLT
jgi:hypothetical protein